MGGYTQCVQMLLFKVEHFPLNCQNSAHGGCYLKSAVFKTSQKSSEFLGHFIMKICTIGLSKVAQFGRTGLIYNNALAYLPFLREACS